MGDSAMPRSGSTSATSQPAFRAEPRLGRSLGSCPWEWWVGGGAFHESDEVGGVAEVVLHLGLVVSADRRPRAGRVDLLGVDLPASVAVALVEHHRAHDSADEFIDI